MNSSLVLEEICCEMAKLVTQIGSTLDQLCGISTRSAAELLVEVGDPCRFTDGGFARFNGTAPLPASSSTKLADTGTPRKRPCASSSAS